jgi:hypothetical protein
MNVVPLRQPCCRATVAVLQHLLDRALAGDVRGLAVCAKGTDGREEIAFSGDYHDDPARAVNAAMRMSWRLTRMQDEMDEARTAPR